MGKASASSPTARGHSSSPCASPQPNRPQSSPAVPSGFRLGGWGRETHGQPIYCAAWSTDLYRERRPPASAPHGQQGHTNGGAPNSSEGGGAAESGTVGQVVDELEVAKPLTDTAKAPRARGDESAPPLLACFATCGGNYATVYEVGVKSKGSGAGSGGGLNVRQAYRDVDADELFFTCAFGGRGIGSQTGYGPEADVVLDADGRTIILDTSAFIDDHPRTSALEEEGSTSALETEREINNKSFKRRRGESDEPNNILSPQESTPKDPLVDTCNSNSRNSQRWSLSEYDGPHLLCCAGRRGVVKVIDTVRRSLLLTLSGHGDEIYDMKFCPTDEWLLVTASKDESLRLWNVQNATCVAIFAGHEGHRDSVLSVGWHPLGRSFASAGMDTTVKLWSLEEEDVADAIERSYNVTPRRRKVTEGKCSTMTGESSSKRPTPSCHQETGPAPTVFRTVYEQMPYFSSNKIHSDYVDCVQFVGDLVLSKSTTNVVVLWKPDLSLQPSSNGSHSTKNLGSHRRIRNGVIALREFALNHCNVWFVRFQTDVDCRMLAIGNNAAEVKVWEMGGSSSNPQKQFFANLTNQHCNSTVRMVSFSPDGKSIIATCDDSSLWKWDAM